MWPWLPERVVVVHIPCAYSIRMRQSIAMAGFSPPARTAPRRSTRDATMTNFWSLPGAASGLLLVISTCAYVKVFAARNQPPCLTHDALPCLLCSGYRVLGR